MEQTALFYRFGAALAIGFLIGLQREYAYGGPGREIFAGERTLALMGLVGENIALICNGLAALTQARRLVFGGATLRNNAALRAILESLFSTLGREVIFLVDGEFAGAVGALELSRRC